MYIQVLANIQIFFNDYLMPHPSIDTYTKRLYCMYTIVSILSLQLMKLFWKDSVGSHLISRLFQLMLKAAFCAWKLQMRTPPSLWRYPQMLLALLLMWRCTMPSLPVVPSHCRRAASLVAQWCTSTMIADVSPSPSNSNSPIGMVGRTTPGMASPLLLPPTPSKREMCTSFNCWLEGNSLSILTVEY